MFRKQKKSNEKSAARYLQMRDKTKNKVDK